MTGTPASLCFDLPELAVLQFQGADAVSFLHAQITNDLEHLPEGRACPAAYCTAKGRTLATLLLWHPQADTVLALVRRDLAESLIKRLRMFVLRSQVVITLSELRVQGISGPAGAGADWDVIQQDGATLIQAPGLLDGATRQWRIAAAPLDAQASQGRWESADILAGLPWVGAAAQDLFIPQTLNLDLIGAINFRKGCYPGQEVVARSHSRGPLRGRMRAAATPVLAVEPPAAEGADVLLSGQDDAPAARIVNRAWRADQPRLYVLLEVQLADLNQDAYCLPDGQALHLQALPYPLPELRNDSGTA
ncbi:CAF17-like 4Fe-4S cluster assembly/insertion protein YgfZ [Alcaligenes sp. Marseille-Q7550]